MKKSKDNSPASKTALITGASSGIGWEFAHCFAQDQWRLILVARRRDKLEGLQNKIKQTYGMDCTVIPLDLSEAGAPQELFNQVKSQDISVDALINNAGVGLYGFFWKKPIEAQLKIMQLNMMALTHLTGLFLPQMIEKQWGRILNVASTAGFQPGPLMAVYYATKAYVVSYSEALANELNGLKGLSVTTLCPGPTESEFQATAGMEKSNLFKSLAVMSSKEVARAGYEGMLKGKTLVIPGWMNKVTVQSNRFGPRKWVTKVVRRVQEPHE